MSDSLADELARILRTVNSLLKRAIPMVSDVEAKKALQEAERYSRFKVWGEGIEVSKAIRIATIRADRMAKEYGEPAVVVDDGGRRVVVLTRARLLKERPFGLGPENIVYETKGRNGR